jgi:hypothetical protein
MSTQVFPTPPTGSGGGGGGTPASSVVSETSYGQSPAVGTSGDFARADHTHGTPTAGAPVGAQYVTLATDATLTNERVLAVTSGDLTRTDGGAGSNVTLGLATVGTLTPGTYTNATVTVDAKGRVTVAANGTTPVTSHTGLTTLGWSAAGHTGTQTSVACFDGTGAAQTVQATADGQVLQRIGGVLMFASVVASVGIGAAEDRTLDVWYFAKNADLIETGSAATGPGSIV